MLDCTPTPPFTTRLPLDTEVESRVLATTIPLVPCRTTFPAVLSITRSPELFMVRFPRVDPEEDTNTPVEPSSALIPAVVYREPPTATLPATLRAPFWAFPLVASEVLRTTRVPSALTVRSPEVTPRPPESTVTIVV